MNIDNYDLRVWQLPPCISCIYRAEEGKSPRVAEVTTEPQARITIRRNSPDDVQQRQIIVKLDGQPAAELLYGDTVTLPVTPGHHRLRVDNTWNWKTLELDVIAGDHLKFVTMSHAGQLASFLMATLGAGPIYVSIHPET